MILQIGAVSLLVFVAGFFMYFILKGVLRQRRLAAWPQVTGTVLEHRRRAAAQGGAFAEFVVRFEFGGVEREAVAGAADGLPYQYPESGDSGLASVLAKRFSRYPVGGPIPLRVNPARADQAHVRDWELPLIAVAIVVGLVFLVFIGMTIQVMF